MSSKKGSNHSIKKESNHSLKKESNTSLKRDSTSSKKSASSKKSDKNDKCDTDSIASNCSGKRGSTGSKKSNSSKCDTDSLISCCKKSSPDPDCVKALEKQYEHLQIAFLSLTSHFAKVQFLLRQIVRAQPCEQPFLLKQLEKIAFCAIDEPQDDDDITTLPKMQVDIMNMGDLEKRQGLLINKLRDQMEELALEIEQAISSEEGSDTDSEEDSSECSHKSQMVCPENEECEEEQQPEEEEECK